MIKKSIAAAGIVGVLATAGVALAQTTVSASASVSASQPQVLNVSSSGKVLVRGTVTAVTDTSVTIQSWGGTWTINVPASAEVLPKGVALSSFKAGDFVGVQGSINSSGSWTVDATLIRDWTERQAISTDVKANVQDIKATVGSGPHNFQGTLSNLSGESFTLTNSSGTAYTVSLTTGAKVVEKNFRTADFAQVQNGDTVRVWGTEASSSISASIFRDLSLPRQ